MAANGSGPAIEVANLSKRFKGTAALDGVSLEVPRGTMVGFLGPNGAGKTTVVRVLATLLKPDAGLARIHGFDVVSQAFQVRQLIGLTGQDTSVDGDLSGLQNLRLIGRLLGLTRREARQRAEDLLEEAGLSDAARRPAKTYSGGMRRRLDLAAGLVSRPAVVFLDEPTTGLDPVRREETWAMIRRLTAEGSTVLLTTQYLEEADQLADDVVVLDSGRVIAHDTPEGLKRQLGAQTLDISIADPAEMQAAAELVHRAVRGQSVQQGSAGRLHVPGVDGSVLSAVIQQLSEHGIEIKELALRLPSLDDVFHALTGPGRAASFRSEEPDSLVSAARGGRYDRL